MLGLGRYQQHKKLNTNPDDGEDDDDGFSNDEDGENVNELRSFGIVPQGDDIFQVTYLGEESITLEAQQIDLQQIYQHVNGPRFSPQNAMGRSKRVELTIDELGINLAPSTPSSSSSTRHVGKFSSSDNNADRGGFTRTFRIPELVHLSTDPFHKKVLVVVSELQSDKRIGGDKRKNYLSVLVCQKESHPVEIIDLCSQRLSPKPKMNSSEVYSNERMLLDKKRTYSPQHTLEFVYNEFEKAGGYKKEDKKSTVVGSKIEMSSSDSSTTSSFFDIDDEFSKLAMKRNESLPDHLQDKSLDSILLIQDGGGGGGGGSSSSEQRSLSPDASSGNINGNNLAKNKERQSSNKSNFFSPSFYNSYSRVSTGS